MHKVLLFYNYSTKNTKLPFRLIVVVFILLLLAL
jgi:hypothetical protein